MKQPISGAWRVRRANSHDAGMLARLGRQTFADAFGAYFQEAELQGYLDDTFRTDKILHALLDPMVIYLVIERDHRAAGYARINLLQNIPGMLAEATAAQLQQIYLLQEHQGTGAGSLLLRQAAIAAATQGAKRLWLQVLTGNSRAIKFYQRHDFDAVRYKRTQFGPLVLPFFFLEKKLASAIGRVKLQQDAWQGLHAA